jgi:hypothetical protein
MQVKRDGGKGMDMELRQRQHLEEPAMKLIVQYSGNHVH